MKSTDENTVTIFSRRIEVRVPIGILAHEKTPQRLWVDIALYADAVTYLQNVSKENLLDYAVLVKAVQAWESRPHVDLIETYIKELLALAFDFPQVVAARVSIAKPDIFANAEQAGVSVMMDRTTYDSFLLSIIIPPPPP